MTDNIIIRIAKLLNSDIPYNTAMNQVMKELGKAIDSDRIYVLGTDGIKVDNAFEYTKDGVYPSIITLKNIPLTAFRTWLDILEDRPFIGINDVESLIGKDLYLNDLLNNLNVSRLIAYPLYNEGKLIGFLVVDKYIEDTEIDAEKIIEDASHFISSRVGNHVLVKRLEKAFKYDALT
jgi:transcriptional regulator with GAF, ATPase, and Fis domain